MCEKHMSTRANIIVKDEYDKLYFYRHSDGYPEGAMPLLNKFVDLVNSQVIRNNVNQSAGWLTVLGAIEYAIAPSKLYQNFDKVFGKGSKPLNSIMPSASDNFSGWKVGSIEPTTAVHGDIEFLYTIDLSQSPVRVICESVTNEKYDRIMER